MSHEPSSGSLPDLPAPPKVSPKRLLGILLALCLGLFAAFLAGYLPYRASQKRLSENARTPEDEVPVVTLVQPRRLESPLSVILPGSIEPLHESTLFPQASGYIRRFLVDIGDHVKAGQLLAEVETPALDQELDQARAALRQAEASLAQTKASREFAHTTLDRYKLLQPSGVASQQDLDQRSAESQVSEANVGAAQAAVGVQAANIRRLTQLKLFAKVIAPFEGVITTRFIDRGVLVTSGSASPLFRLVANDPVRVFVQVPQDVAPQVHPGAHASLTLREYAGRTFTGIIKRTAGALDAVTRTLNTEVRIPNPKNELLSGMYTDVMLTLTSPRVLYELPGTALYDDGLGLRVAVLDRQNRVHFLPVILNRDLGATVLISSGLSGKEKVIRLANPRIKEGLRVRVQGEAPAKGAKDAP